MDFLAPFFLAIFLWWNPIIAYPPPLHKSPPDIGSFTIKKVDIHPMQARPKLSKSTQKVGASDPLMGEESLYAEVINGVVQRVIVIDQANVDTGKWGDPKNWVQTSARGTIRKNSAGYGYTYDKTLDAFIAPKPTSTATLDEATAKWVVPVQMSTFINSTSTQ